MGPLVSMEHSLMDTRGRHRAFSEGYQGESIKHSLMDLKRGGGAQNAQQYARLETYMLALQLPV